MRGRVILITALAMFAVGLALSARSGAPSDNRPIDEHTGEVDDTPAHPVARAVWRSRQAGSARTQSVARPGLTGARSSGVVSFRSGRSDTLIDLVGPDGDALPYARIVRTPERVYAGMYLGRPEPAWRHIEPAALAEEAMGFHVDGLLVLDALHEQHAALAGDPDRARGYRRLGPPPTGPDNVLGIVILAFELDGKARVGTVRYTLPGLREHVFTMTFTDYGEAPPVEVPTADV